MKVIITGAEGQLGRALQELYPEAAALARTDLDISNKEEVRRYDWSDVEAIINAAAYTKVDDAETTDGFVSAWQSNAQGPLNLGVIARERELILAHISTDYVFDGQDNEPYTEDSPVRPLSSYGRTKLAGDLVVESVPKHYLVRTSWVIGNGGNFVRTMLGLGGRGVEPKVVSDQIGRPSFTVDLARAIDHLLTRSAEFGTYNFSNNGEPVSWAQLTREIFNAAGYNLNVEDVTTEDYFAGKPQTAKRPLYSLLNLDKLEKTGFENRDWKEALKEYVSNEASAV